MAVGKYDKTQKMYAGACSGDSGGPLFANSNGQQYLVGVTSFGAEDCEEFSPSVVSIWYTESNSKNPRLPFREDFHWNPWK